MLPNFELLNDRREAIVFSNAFSSLPKFYKVPKDSHAALMTLGMQHLAPKQDPKNIVLAATDDCPQHAPRISRIEKEVWDGITLTFTEGVVLLTNFFLTGCILQILITWH